MVLFDEKLKNNYYFMFTKHYFVRFVIPLIWCIILVHRRRILIYVFAVYKKKILIFFSVLMHGYCGQKLYVRKCFDVLKGYYYFPPIFLQNLNVNLF